MSTKFKVIYPDGTTQNFVQFMTQLAVDGMSIAYDTIAECENDGVQPIDLSWLTSPAVLVSLMRRKHMKIVLSSANRDLTYTFSHPFTDSERVDIPTDCAIHEVSIIYSDTGFSDKSQSEKLATPLASDAPAPAPLMDTKELEAADKLEHIKMFDIFESTTDDNLTIPPRTRERKDPLSSLLQSMPKEVQDELMEREQYMNFVHLVESIRTNPEYDAEAPLDWPVQTLVDYLYRRTPGDVYADEALALAAKANRELLKQPAVWVQDSYTDRAVKVTLGKEEAVTVAYVNAYERKHLSMTLNYAVSLKDDVSVFEITKCTETGESSAWFKHPAVALRQISIVLTQFLNKILDPNGILDILTIIMQTDTGAPGLRVYLRSALETRVTAGSSARLFEETVRICSTEESKVLRLVQRLRALLQENSVRGFASRSTAHKITGHMVCLAVESNIVSEIIEVLITDILVVIYPVISTLAYRIMCNLANALARTKDAKSPITPSLSHFGPHIVTTYRSKNRFISVAHSLIGDPFALDKMLVLGKKRAADLANILEKGGTTPVTGIPQEIHSLFILPDPQVYSNIHLCAVLVPVSVRMYLEKCLKASLERLSVDGHYVIAHRKPLELEELITNGNLVKQTIYRYTGISSHRWAQRGATARRLSRRPSPYQDRGELTTALANINAAIAQHAHFAKQPLDMRMQADDFRTICHEGNGATITIPLRHLRVLQAWQSGAGARSDVTRVLPAGSPEAVSNNLRWYQAFDQYPVQLKMLPQSVVALRKMASIHTYKILLCNNMDDYHNKPYTHIDPAQVQECTSEDGAPVETKFSRLMKSIAWYEMPRIEEVRQSLQRRHAIGEFNYGIIGQTPDASKVLYPAFSFYLPDAFQFNYMWFVFLGEMLPLSDYIQTDSPKEEKIAAEVQDYVQSEYSKAYLKAKEARLRLERKRVLEELRRLREEYATRYRNKIPYLRRKNSEVAKLLHSSAEMFGEEYALKQYLSRGHIEGFRVINNTLLLKIPEVNIYEQGLIFNIGKFAVSIQGFDGAAHYEIRFYNISQHQYDRLGANICDHPHVRNGRACLGNVENMLNNAIQNDDLLTVVELCKGYLNSVNSNDTFGRYIFTKWPFAMPTVHNLIKLGITRQINKNTLIVLYRTTEKNKIVVEMAKDLPYYKILAEFEAAKADIMDLSQRGSDCNKRICELPIDVQSAIPALAYIKENEYNGRQVTTLRSDAEIQRSIIDFQGLIANEEAWNKTVARNAACPEVVITKSAPRTP